MILTAHRRRPTCILKGISDCTPTDGPRATVWYTSNSKANAYSIYKANQTVSTPKRQKGKLYVSNVYMDGETERQCTIAGKAQDVKTGSPQRQCDVMTLIRFRLKALDSLCPCQQFFSHVRAGLHVLNQS